MYFCTSFFIGKIINGAFSTAYSLGIGILIVVILLLLLLLIMSLLNALINTFAYKGSSSFIGFMLISSFLGTILEFAFKLGLEAILKLLI